MKKISLIIKRKISAVAAVCVIAAGFFSLYSCGSPAKPNEKISIVTTIFPEYDWVINVLGDKLDNAEVTFLLESGADLHNFSPTVEDIAKIAACDLFIYVGGESDDWVNSALANASNKDMIKINLLEVLGDSAKEEELVEGMEGDDEDEDEDEIEYDEHVWLSLKNAKIFVFEIAQALEKIDPQNAAIYSANAVAYGEKLDALDKEYSSAVSSASGNTFLFGDRFPFRYLADDYNISYYAAFAGCSAETNASFETIVFLAGKVDELGLKTILTLENSDGKIANTVKGCTKLKNQAIIKMNSLQSATMSDYKNGVTYISIMEENLKALKTALNY